MLPEDYCHIIISRLVGNVNVFLEKILEREFGISDPPRKLNRQLEKVADSFGNITDI